MLRLSHLAAPALLLLRASSPEAPEPLSTYEIRLRQQDGIVEISGDAVFPPLDRETREFTFLVTPLVPEPRFTLFCGSTALDVATTSSEESGDRQWRLTSADSCPAQSVVRLAFAYAFDSSMAAPQLRIGRNFGFAGGGGETWYPQRSFAERQRGSITLDLPAHLTGIATGALASETTAGGRRIHRYTTEGPAKLAFAFAPYAVSRALTRPAISVLTLGSQSQAAELSTGLAAQLRALERVFGKAPFSALSLVETDFQSRVLGTSEYGMIFADPSKLRGPFDAPYWAHEFGHQWWGVGLRPAAGSAGATLLTEGLAQYGALLALEAVEGPAAAAAYRREGRGSRSGSLAMYRELLAAGRDRPIADTLAQGDQQEILLAHNLATTKGAIVLRYFAALAGTERVNRILRRFFATHANRRVAWAELEAALDSGTGGRFRWFLDQWLHRAGAPALTIDYCIHGSRVRGRIRQSAPEFRLPLTLELAGRWGSRRVTVTAQGTATPFDLRTPGALQRVHFDPDALVPTASSEIVESCPGT